MSKLTLNVPSKIFYKASLVSPAQIEVVLRDQMRYRCLRLGEIQFGEVLALRGWLRRETTNFFSDESLFCIIEDEKHHIRAEWSNTLAIARLKFVVRENRSL
jgi:hypothetical protein